MNTTNHRGSDKINGVTMPAQGEDPPIGQWADQMDLQKGDIVDVVWARGAPKRTAERMFVDENMHEKLHLRVIGGAPFQWRSIGMREHSYVLVARAVGADGLSATPTQTIHRHRYTVDVHVESPDFYGRDVTERMLLTAMRHRLSIIEAEEIAKDEFNLVDTDVVSRGGTHA